MMNIKLLRFPTVGDKLWKMENLANKIIGCTNNEAIRLQEIFSLILVQDFKERYKHELENTSSQDHLIHKALNEMISLKNQALDLLSSRVIQSAETGDRSLEALVLLREADKLVQEHMYTFSEVVSIYKQPHEKLYMSGVLIDFLLN